MIEGGRIQVSADELAQFTDLAAVEPVARHLFLLNTTTGETRVERRGDWDNIPDGWILLMTGPTPSWVEQWQGDLQRALDEQLNPLLAEATGYPAPTNEEGP